MLTGAALLAAVDGVQLVDLLEVVEAPHRAVHEGTGQRVVGDALRAVGVVRVAYCRMNRWD